MLSFTSKNLNRNIAFSLKVERLEFSEEELKSLKELEIDPCADNSYFEVNEELLSYFPNLNKLTIKNMPLTDRILNFIAFKMNNLKELILVNSSVPDLKLIANKRLNNLVLNNTYIKDFEELKYFKFLNKLSLIDMKDVDIVFLRDMPNLSFLELSYSNVKRYNYLSSFPLIEVLKIDNTKIDDLSFLLSMEKLKKVLVSNDQVDNNKFVLNKLIKKDVLVIEDGIINHSLWRKVV